MHADFSVELGRDDAALELPWSSADPTVRFCDLKKYPELLQQVPEAMAYPELGAFLARINAAGFPLATAKCDAWQSREVAKEEEIYGDRKFVSYVDLIFEDEAARCSFEKHEAFTKTLCRLLSQTPEIPAAVEVVIRRCYYHSEGALRVVAANEGGAEGRDDVEEVTGAERAAEEGGTKVEEFGREGITAAAETATDEAGGRDVAEQWSGVANREGTDRADASERTKQQADVGHGMKCEGSANAGEQGGADIEKTKAAERLDQTAADERVEPGDPDGSVSGFSFTAYVTGFGDSDHEPHLRWQIALALLQNALVQLARDCH
jgi:hypothetical protein